MSVPEKKEAGNRGLGRPKGSRNKVTMMKLAAESAVRENNLDRMVEVCRLIIDQALEGDAASQKLIWQSVVSNGISEESSGSEKVTITVNAAQQQPPATIIEHPAQESIDETVK